MPNMPPTNNTIITNAACLAMPSGTAVKKSNRPTGAALSAASNAACAFSPPEVRMPWAETSFSNTRYVPGTTILPLR